MRIATEVLKCVYLLFVIIRKVIVMPPMVVVVLVATGGLVGVSWYIWLAISWMHDRWAANRTGSVMPDEVITEDVPETDPADHFGHPVA